MKNTVLIGILLVVALGIIGGMAVRSFSGDGAVREMVAEATIFKSPSCGCCSQYATYLEREGYGITVEGVQDMAVVKERYGVPYELESCHTMEVAGYVVEGHVPEAAVRKLLDEQPDIRGIGMAGMPSGSPGMPGPKTEDFIVYEITHEGERGEVFMTI